MKKLFSILILLCVAVSSNAQLMEELTKKKTERADTAFGYFTVSTGLALSFYAHSFLSTSFYSNDPKSATNHTVLIGIPLGFNFMFNLKNVFIGGGIMNQWYSGKAYHSDSPQLDSYDASVRTSLLKYFGRMEIPLSKGDGGALAFEIGSFAVSNPLGVSPSGAFFINASGVFHTELSNNVNLIWEFPVEYIHYTTLLDYYSSSHSILNVPYVLLGLRYTL